MIKVKDDFHIVDERHAGHGDSLHSHDQTEVPGGDGLVVPLAQTAELCTTKGEPAVRTDCIIYYVVPSRVGTVGMLGMPPVNLNVSSLW